MNGPLKSQEPVQPPRQQRPTHDRESQREPLFGPGAGRFLAEPMVSVGTLASCSLRCSSRAASRNEPNSLLFGEPQRVHTLKPSESILTDGYKVKRMD